MRVEKKAFAYRIYSHFTQQCAFGIYGVPEGKPALSMEKGCNYHKETVCMLWINPVIFTDCGETQ